MIWPFLRLDLDRMRIKTVLLLKVFCEFYRIKDPEQDLQYKANFVCFSKNITIHTAIKYIKEGRYLDT